MIRSFQFPVFKEGVSANEYNVLGEDFEKKEHDKLEAIGFFMMVEKAAEIKKQIGIYDMDQFTPKV